MRYFGAAVRSTIPVEPQWELEYYNWWGEGYYRIFVGTEQECLREQEIVEQCAWNMFCQGYGPSEPITIYIGKKRPLDYSLFNYSRKILKEAFPAAYAEWEKANEEFNNSLMTDQGQAVGSGFGPDPRDYM